MTRISAEIQRTDGNVFVSVRNPNPNIVVTPTPIEQQYSNWMQVADDIATDTPPIPEPEVETPSPNDEAVTIDDIFAESLPKFIEASRWGRYIVPGPASRIFDNTVFIYHNPCDNFWDLYELSKGIFRTLGIRVAKPGGTWEARIPIRCLTDKVFVESGLAAVEKTLLAHTGIDPVAILQDIRERQFQETQDGIRNVKFGKAGAREAIGDAVGAIALFVASYLSFVVGGV